MKRLQQTAADCESAASVINALKCLEEHREFLPKTLVPMLGPYGCQALEGEGLSLAMESGKAAVRAALTSVSTRMLEEVQSGKPAASERLLQLCKSTELNAMLGEDLEKVYILKPMAAKLAPSQGGPGSKHLCPVWGSVVDSL